MSAANIISWVIPFLDILFIVNLSLLLTPVLSFFRILKIKLAMLAKISNIAENIENSKVFFSCVDGGWYHLEILSSIIFNTNFLILNE